jgi:hypothetical protein
MKFIHSSVSGVRVHVEFASHEKAIKFAVDELLAINPNAKIYRSPTEGTGIMILSAFNPNGEFVGHASMCVNPPLAV